MGQGINSYGERSMMGAMAGPSSSGTGSALKFGREAALAYTAALGAQNSSGAATGTGMKDLRSLHQLAP